MSDLSGSELSGAADHPLIDALEALHRLVGAEPLQPLMQLAEGLVMHWHRVVDGHELIQPRLVPDGYIPTAFHFGMEPDARNRLDDCGIAAEGEGFDAVLAERLEALAGDLARYFDHPGYRSSSDQCDQLMVRLARVSRFVGTWAAEAELSHRRRWKGRAPEPGGGIDLYAPPAEAPLLWRVRWALAFWEPYLNGAITAWEANNLEAFDGALRSLQEALGRREAERRERLPPPGYPLRRRGQHRLKVSVLEPEQKPLRMRSVFWVRYNQLIERLFTAAYVPPERLDALEADVRHFIRMVETNHFMLVFEPGFLARGRPGVTVIRGRPTMHPLLLDPPGFFKRAVLFHNGTYTVAGGGIDRMYLQLRQLERFFKYEGWSAQWRPLRPTLERSVIAWEENRWSTFTEAMLQLAEQLRGDED